MQTLHFFFLEVHLVFQIFVQAKIGKVTEKVEVGGRRLFWIYARYLIDIGRLELALNQAT